MKYNGYPRGARRLWLTILLFGVLLFTGCQSYQPVSLDLEQHQADAALRVDEHETLYAFSQRLATGDAIEPFDLDDGIHAAEAEVIALFYNRELRLARLHAGVALANAETAGLWDDPVFGFDGAELISPTGPFEYGLTLSLTIPVSGQLNVAQDKADAAYNAELRRIVDAEWSMRARVREAWVVWSVANERLKLIDQIVEAIERISAVSDRLEEGGELTRVEARLIHAQLLTTRLERVSAAAEANQARLGLLGLMGLLPEAEVLLVSALPTVVIPEVSDRSDRLIQANTLLAALRADYQVAEQALRLEVRKQYPDIEIGGGFGSEDGDDRLLFGASLPIPIFNANRGGIAEARANRELARAMAETEFERLAFQLASARARLDATEQQRQALEDELVPMLDEQSAEIDRLAELGEVNTLILLETVARRFEAKSQILDLHRAALRDRIEVVRLLGPADAIDPAPVSENTHLETTSGSSDALDGDLP